VEYDTKYFRSCSLIGESPDGVRVGSELTIAFSVDEKPGVVVVVDVVPLVDFSLCSAGVVVVVVVVATVVVVEDGFPVRPFILLIRILYNMSQWSDPDRNLHCLKFESSIPQPLLY